MLPPAKIRTSSMPVSDNSKKRLVRSWRMASNSRNDRSAWIVRISPGRACSTRTKGFGSLSQRMPLSKGSQRRRLRADMRRQMQGRQAATSASLSLIRIV